MSPLRENVIAYGITIFILIIPVYIIVITISPILLLVLLYRTCLKNYVKVSKPEYGKMIPIKAAAWSFDVPGANAKNSVLISVVFEGFIDIENLRESILNRISNEKDENNQQRYPELQQTLSEYWGYRFWKWDKKFDIKNHVKLGLGDDKVVYKNNLDKITADLLPIPFKEDISPWEVYLLPYKNDEDDNEAKCITLIRYSHALGDGLSLVEMISSASKQPLPVSNVKVKRAQKYIFRILNIFLTPYGVLKTALTTNDRNIVKIPNAGASTKTLIVQKFETVPVLLIKSIKEKFKASFLGVQLATFTIGLRNVMLANDMKIPRIISIMTPVPIHGHRDKLRNAVKFAPIFLPVGMTEMDAETRLNFIEAQLKSLKHSGLVSQLFYYTLCLGMLPISLVRFLQEKTMSHSGFVSSISVPFKEVNYDNHQLLEFSFAMNVFHGSTWLGISCTSYYGKLDMQPSFLVNGTNIAQTNVFQDGVLKELEKLSNLQPNSFKCV